MDRLFGARLQCVAEADLKDPKSRLQELLQQRRLALPDYSVVERGGAFTVACVVAELELGATGGGRTRREAEQEAAAGVLEALAQPDAAAT